jgi:hypothetical protein
MRLMALVEVATFQQGNHYISGILLFAISAIEKGVVNYIEWFKVRLHKEMIVV